MDWLTTKVTHSISDAGYTSRIEMETRTEEAEVEREDELDRDPGVTGVIAKWRDIISNKTGRELEPTTGTGKLRKPVAGAAANPKTLTHIYANRQTAQHAAKSEWAKIIERRNIIRDNSE
ncbi:hypothetical protein [Collimonas sp.]|jgi:phage protein D|uniref:hypothetical protein n=1 Tax=Collimonas sp. TaxID=1963772 RepID=UPI002BBF1E6A|nr:hypothetical protein [Collimonas sp.]HWX02496.1 hypothetical protein [Collimonas sp.]